MPVPANVERRFQQKAMDTYCDCYSTATLFYLSVVLWRSAGSSGELKVVWVGAVCVVEKCVASRNFWLLGELHRQFLTRVYIYIYIYVCVCVYVCIMYVCMYACMYLGMHVCVYICMYVYICYVCVCVCVCVLVDCFTGRTTEELCFSFHQVKEFYFLFIAPRGPLEPTQFLHLSGTGYPTQRVKAAQQLTICTWYPGEE